ncbi:recombination mediator RecR [Neptuniibacter pectenicola]|jgi:recombination protein RecR|uniref:Recombination protein RecR n=1 Tax=Neptuniibacter pectenicola TaxID=1806669 RepID=A0ABU9TNN6_9GAMM|nr:recombination mediator RecR [Neptuniibacter pectenicola]|tara:strand:- start:693 stop:1292 length:600 start_codon:yes stop_codon:yes gene_type:complete
MSFSPLIQQLITALRCLPSVGPKSAQRMAFHLLERDSEGALALSEILQKAVAEVGHCRQCRTLSEHELCEICKSESRDRSILCVLESPVDVLAIEQTGGYNGLYFVLSGHLSPIDGIGPEDLGIDKLLDYIHATEINEIILATNPTVEGEATAHFIAAQVKELGIKVTRIAHGVPVGGELEFVDGGTLAHAMAGRRSLL